MFYTGEKVKFYDNDAIVLTCREDEVLIFVGKDTVKWVDKGFLEILPMSN